MNDILAGTSLADTRLLISTADCNARAEGKLKLTTSREMGLLGVFLGRLS